MTNPAGTSLDYRFLMQEVERVVETVDSSEDEASAVFSISQAVIEVLGDHLSLTGGRVYVREGNDYLLWKTFGGAKQVASGTHLPKDYAPIRKCLDQGTVYATLDDPELDQALEGQLGVERFAGIEISDRQYLVAFDLAADHQEDQVLFALALLRNSINDKVRQERIEEVLRQARRIQASILPHRMPEFAGYDIAARSQPLETVGGDFYDYLRLSEKILGLAIADVSGHGLPAALQVRDIYMGLRMGMARDFKIVRTVERLNQIIHVSTLTSRFVSMFYGELESDGTLIYVNAGHPAPFHVNADGDVRFLTEGGVILGPIPNASYTRGYLTMTPGDMLVLYTDGITETACEANGARDEYGAERLVELARESRALSSQEVVARVFDEVGSFCDEVSAEDDRTVVVVKR